MENNNIKQSIYEGFASTLSLSDFVICILIGILLSILLSKVYVKYGRSHSNRQLFSENFLLITLTTILVIAVVKSSLALSLGLVGALSIVRFRTAIKEPEELSYTFLSIAIGLGLGANQKAITVIFFIIIVFTLMLRSRFKSNKYKLNNNLIISGDKSVEISDIIEILNKYSSSFSLRRFHQSDNYYESSFLIDFEKFDNFLILKKELNSKYPLLEINLSDNIDY